MARFRLFLLIMMGVVCYACQQSSIPEAGASSTRPKKVDYIRAIPGEDQEIATEILERGKVLISYSDCYVCHKEGKKVVGPSFSDIALRYPVDEVFINILARRVIDGGSGAWGHSTMSPHPSLPEEDARAMVSYILTIKKEPGIK